jgi:hypothetical protein
LHSRLRDLQPSKLRDFQNLIHVADHDDDDAVVLVAVVLVGLGSFY